MIQKSRLGHKIPVSSAGERVEAFVPPLLPPDPPVRMEGLYPLLEGANRGLGQLDGMCRVLPDKLLFLYTYVRKEALISCQIEGTKSSLSDVLISEKVRPVRADGVREVSNYVNAMEYGLKRVRGDDFPVSQRLMREIHEKLLAGGREEDAQPGEYRRSQNWIDGTRPGNAVYVPPPHHMLPDLMSDLEKFIHRPTPDLPDLVKAGLVHVQFETIHPFLDGNGRLGRLLITFLLCAQDILREPLLYLSLYFKTHRARYYELLQMVREEGAWEEWLAFFLEGVQDTANQAADSAGQILDLFERDHGRITKAGGRSRSVLRLHEFMQQDPIFSAPEAAKQLELSTPTIWSGIRALRRLGMIVPIGTRFRPQHFAYADYLKILRLGTDPL